jgi:hypothetical protein
VGPKEGEKRAPIKRWEVGIGGGGWKRERQEKRKKRKEII